MADMVLLKYDIGSKAATVLCPECGRISRQFLTVPYSPNRIDEQIQSHTCPICGTAYRNCSSSQAENWSAALARYSNKPTAYNDSAKADYIRRRTSQAPSASQTAIPLQSASAAPSEPVHNWFCEVTFSRISEIHSYISDIGRIDAGTEAVVPFGAENTQRIGIVKACRFLTEQETPCSAEKAKHIICKAARADFQPVETVPSIFDNSVNKYISLMSTLQQVAERKTMEANNEQTSVAEAHVMRSVNAKEDLPSAVTSYSTPAETPGKSLSAIGTPAPVSEEAPIASDENLDHKIEFWKRELLDTGKRNKMINYKETKRATLRILEPESSELFNRLAFSDKPLTFQKPINKDSDFRTYSMIALMETLSYSLNVQVGDIKTAGTIIEREKTLKNLRSKAKLAQEEQGANILYLCFGFIYWRAQNRESSPWLKAPLLMMPVTLGLKSLSTPYTLSRYDDEIEVNPTLS